MKVITAVVISKLKKESSIIIAVHSAYPHELPIIGYFQPTENFPDIPDADIGKVFYAVTVETIRGRKGIFYNKIYINKP